MKFYLHPSYQIITSLFYKYVKIDTKVSVLDSGCGNGYLLELLGCNNVLNYKGYDVSVAAISYAKTRFGNDNKIEFKTVKVDNGMPKYKENSFDVIFSIGVLQYLNDSEIKDFFNRARKVIKNNGKVLISCTTDHSFYKWFSLYNLVLPSHVNNRKKIIKLAKEAGLKCLYQRESGLFLGPLFSHNLVLFFDALDKILFRQKGKLGFFGKGSRIISTFILQFEHYLPIDYGYTMYLVLGK